MECCHCNGICDDNRIENLRWDTRKANMGDKVVHGTDPKGERNGQAKLTQAKVIEIRRLGAEGWTQVGIAAKFGVSDSTIRDILTRRKWACVE
jgi:hypothetical protein